MSPWIDLSIDVRPDMPRWEGAEPPRLETLCEIGPDSPCRVSRAVLDVHLGTHVDAPCHYLPGAPGVESLSLDDLAGECWIADAGDAPIVTESVLEGLGIPAGTRRLLVRTSNTRRGLLRRPGFVRDFAALDLSGARWLLRRGVRLVGFDYLSVQALTESDDVHRGLLAARVVLLEGLDLSAVEPGLHELVCLTPRWTGSDGAPARAVVRRLEP